MRRGPGLICFAMALVGVAAAGALGQEPSGGDGKLVVLDGAGSLWRGSIQWRRPIVLEEDGTLRPIRLQDYFWMSAEGPGAKEMPELEPSGPPDGWQGRDFDDSDWMQGHCPVGPAYRPKDWRAPALMMWSSGSPAQAARVAARGKFRVIDPARAGRLSVTVRFQGGAALYLNGKEVARSHLPAGELSSDLLATPYADDVYRDARGEAIVGVATAKSTPAELAQFEKRVRTLSAELPGDLLRAGVNVLAVEVRRAPYKAIYQGAESEYHGKKFRQWPIPWAHCRLLDVELTASGGAALQTNVGRPAGVQLWRPVGWATVTGFDYGDACEEPAEIRLAGIRNGVHHGRLVVSSAEEIKGLKASAGELRGEGGAVIPASSVHVRYARASGYRFDALSPDVPAKVAVEHFRRGRRDPGEKAAAVPIWVTVHVPADARPGSYRGGVSVSADGLERREVPLVIDVHGWTLPEPRGLVAHNDFWQSPETLAYTWKVPLWSDRHFELIGQSLKLTAPLANKFAAVHLVAGAFQCGNRESMVRWVRAGGSDEQPKYEYDFAAFERYLDTYGQALGKPTVLMIDVSVPVHSSQRPKDNAIETTVTLLDRASGRVEPLKVRLKDEKDLVAFWDPVLGEVKRRLTRRGWWDAVVFGTASDSGPIGIEGEAFKRIWPDRGWLFSGHPDKKSVPGGAAVRCIEWVWGVGRSYVPRPGKFAYPMPWKSESTRISLAFPRMGSDICELRQDFSLADYRLSPERTLQAGNSGIGRVGIDMWPYEHAPGRFTQLVSDGGQFTFNAGVAWFLAPGESGPLPTTRSEMFREGLQVREAMTALLKAVDGGKLDEATAARVRALLDERAAKMLSAGGIVGRRADEERLFALAAEVCGE